MISLLGRGGSSDGLEQAPVRVKARRRHPVLRRFFKDRGTVIAVTYLVVLTAMAVLAPHVAPELPNAQDLKHRLVGFGQDNLLGTDDFGRDQLSRLLYGSRTSLVAAVSATAYAAVLGIPAGIMAGYLGGRFDRVLTWFNDMIMSLPALLLAVSIVAVLGPSLANAMLAVGMAFSPRFYRLARAGALDVRHETYIEASVVIGCSRGRILTRHVLPNSVSPLIVQGALTMSSAILAEASLSFLGLGVRPPNPSWGSMLDTAFRNINTAQHLAFPPGIMIGLTVLAFLSIGEGWRDALSTGRNLIGKTAKP